MAPDTHPDLADLDALRSGEGRPEDEAHVRGCASCQGVLEELRDIAAAVHAELTPPFAVPAERDTRILWVARKQAAAVRRSPWLAPRWGIAAAAVLLLAAASLLRLRGGELRAPTIAAVPRAAADTDADGRVDIRDAFAIARAVRAGAPMEPRWDVDGDGRVDLADADAVARAAVALGGA